MIKVTFRVNSNPYQYDLFTPDTTLREVLSHFGAELSRGLSLYVNGTPKYAADFDTPIGAYDSENGCRISIMSNKDNA